MTSIIYICSKFSVSLKLKSNPIKREDVSMPCSDNGRENKKHDPSSPTGNSPWRPCTDPEKAFVSSFLSSTTIQTIRTILSALLLRWFHTTYVTRWQSPSSKLECRGEVLLHVNRYITLQQICKWAWPSYRIETMGLHDEANYYTLTEFVSPSALVMDPIISITQLTLSNSFLSSLSTKAEGCSSLFL